MHNGLDHRTFITGTRSTRSKLRFSYPSIHGERCSHAYGGVLVGKLKRNKGLRDPGSLFPALFALDGFGCLFLTFPKGVPCQLISCTLAYLFNLHLWAQLKVAYTVFQYFLHVGPPCTEEA